MINELPLQTQQILKCIAEESAQQAATLIAKILKEPKLYVIKSVVNNIPR